MYTTFIIVSLIVAAVCFIAHQWYVRKFVKFYKNPDDSKANFTVKDLIMMSITMTLLITALFFQVKVWDLQSHKELWPEPQYAQYFLYSPAKLLRFIAPFVCFTTFFNAIYVILFCKAKGIK